MIRHCEPKAKQSISLRCNLSRQRELDCFLAALLSMTGASECIAALTGTTAAIARGCFIPHIAGMTLGERWRDLGRTRMQRLVLLIIGIFLVIISPLVGAIPGPGGIFVFAAGFGMMLKSSRWVKKRFVRFKARHPTKGAWVDWGLRRPSYLRRRDRDSELACPAEECRAKVDLTKCEPGREY